MSKVVKHSIISATGVDGENLILIQFIDDTLGITRDGRHIDEWSWGKDDIDTAVLTLMLLADVDFPVGDEVNDV